MTFRTGFAAAALAATVSTLPTPTSAQDVRVPGPSSSGTGAGAPVYASLTLYGCVERESDYRAAQGGKHGGLVGTGIGLGNEFILTQTGRSRIAASRSGEGSAETPAELATYELTGPAENDAANFVGRRVEVSGHFKTNKTTDLGLPRFAVLLVRQAPGTCR